MTRSLLGALVLCAVLAGGGCGDDDRASGADGSVTRLDAGGADAARGVDSGGPGGGGDCASDGDCPGGACVELVPGGYRVCNVPPEEATECGEPTIDECCDSSECSTGSCWLGPVTPFCGGPGVIPHNVCAEDDCASDADCPDSTICVPGGSLGRTVSSCVFATCRTDADCAEAAGGACVTVTDPCCGVQSLACVYPGGCRTSADCPGGACMLRGPRMECSDMPAPCPA